MCSSNKNINNDKNNLSNADKDRCFLSENNLNRRQALNLLAISSSTLLLSGCVNVFSLLAPVDPHSTIYSASMDSAPSSSVGHKAVKSAKSQIGVRYVLGGTSPRTGFDCSGLIYWAYNEHGVKIPRVTKDQAYAGVPVALDNLEAGDILVFASTAAPNSLHTALYMGDKNFIHSPNSKSKVRKNSLTENYWGSHLAFARRIV